MPCCVAPPVEARVPLVEPDVPVCVVAMSVTPYAMPAGDDEGTIVHAPLP